MADKNHTDSKDTTECPNSHCDKVGVHVHEHPHDYKHKHDDHKHDHKSHEEHLKQ